MTETFRIATATVSLQWVVAPAPAGITVRPGVGTLKVRPLRRDVDILVLDRGGNAADRVDVTATVGPPLFEQTEYRLLIEATRGHSVDVEHRDPTLLSQLTSTSDGRIMHGTVNFGSRVGHSVFVVLVSGRAEFEFEVEVFPTKLDYRSDYEEMLSEVQAAVEGLAFEYLQATDRTGSFRRGGNATRSEWLTILRNVVVDRLEPALHQISSRPLRAISRELQHVSIRSVRKVDSAVRRTLTRAMPSKNVDYVVRGRVFPSAVYAAQPVLTADTAEHRWIAAQLARMLQRLVQLINIESAREPSQRRHAAITEMRQIMSRLSALAQLAPFRTASAMPPSGFTSLQLLRAPAYQEAYVACVALSAALNLDGDVLRLSLKDIAKLYEYWAFFTVARLVAEAIGQRLPPEGFVRRDERGLSVTIKTGTAHSIVFETGFRSVTLTFNPTFGGGAMLVPQRPDFLLTFKERGWPTMRVVIDAKYRVDVSPEYRERYGVPGPPEDALNVLHRYRDAILASSVPGSAEFAKRSVVQAVAVYPYQEADGESFRRSRLCAALTSVGAGAIPLLPSNQASLELWLNDLLLQGGWAVSDRAPRHTAAERAAEWKAAALEAAMVGVLRGGDEERHLEWLHSSRRYYTPLTRQKRLFSVKYVAIYEPAKLSGRGIVRRRARVNALEVVRRKEIATPWSSRRDGDEMQVVLHLDAFEEDLAIVNRRGERVSSSRWTSRLALERASSLEELLLETEPEWRFYETLRAANYTFDVAASDARLQTAVEPVGRARFVVGSSTVQYRGAAGFLLHDEASARYVTWAQLRRLVEQRYFDT